MDKVFSARLDKRAIAKLEHGTRTLGITKKRFLEEAIEMRLQQVKPVDDIWERSCGIWKRDEPAKETVARMKRAMQDAYERHHKSRHARLRG